ncbi:uncharacterized protein DUF2642 [Melghirimyces profundicolus]|uniref:Uncharacterized protein DUF2642 n=1 Tax=Melghirimyces profundicolus TaxID=1242148 RepID=A0A2T6BQJ1_9BACL|nr:DUF2642 domain-containing protein [Melghirimyces profundicolus]PTX58306.1 uncharacterized protein DUF2642 [Melghirimyces profundicolus]
MDECFHPMVPRYGYPQMPGYAPGPPGPPLDQPPYPFPQPLPGLPGEMAPMPPESSRPMFGRSFKNPFKGLLRRRPKDYLLSHQMYRVMGQRVKVSTLKGDLDGDIAGVYPDHLLISKDDQKYHIRWDAIVYVAPVEEL